MLFALVFAGAVQPNLEIGGNLTPAAQIAGPWEDLVAPGKVIGFSLQIVTKFDNTVWEIILDTYDRGQTETAKTWWSEINPNPSTFILRGGRLRFHQAQNPNGPFSVTLDLTYDPDDTAWKGTFGNPYFSGKVVLHRPEMDVPDAPTGTWRTYSDTTIWPTQRVQEFACLNMGVGADGALVLWAESHNVLVTDPTAQHPFIGDSYGEFYDDSHATRYVNEWSFITGTALSSERTTGVLSSDGSAFGGYFSDHHGNGEIDPSHPRAAFAWTRMQNLSCRP